MSYDFNESDFNISRKLCSLYLEKAWADNDEFLPWNSLKYLIGDAMYGGRVSDGMDRRVLVCYLNEYMGDFLFDDCQKFRFSNVGFSYELPEWGDLQNYTEVIILPCYLSLPLFPCDNMIHESHELQMVESLPLTNSPAVFGLHPNAEIGYYSNAVKSMWMDLIALQPRTSGGGDGKKKFQHRDVSSLTVFLIIRASCNLYR